MRTPSPSTPGIPDTPHELSSSRYGGRSMWPVFQAGDVLILRSPRIRRPRPGDCIVFRNNDDRLVAHRLIALHPAPRTKGDALPEPDAEAPRPDTVQGVVVGRIRNGAYRRVRGGRMGLVQSRILPLLGRVEHERPAGRGRRVATLVSALAALLAPGLASRVRVSGAERTRLLWLGERPIGRVAADDRWVVSWPYSLVVRGPLGNAGAP